MVIKLPKDVDLSAAEMTFAARQAGRDLAESPGDAARPSLKALLSGTETAGPVPMGLLRLRRQFARAHALGVSPAAKAAHTAEDIARKIGIFTLQLIDDDDVVFLTIAGPEGQDLPTRIDAFLEAQQRHAGLDLPPAIQGTVQVGLARNIESSQDLLNILSHPEAEIILS